MLLDAMTLRIRKCYSHTEPTRRCTCMRRSAPQNMSAFQKWIGEEFATGRNWRRNFCERIRRR